MKPIFVHPKILKEVEENEAKESFVSFLLRLIQQKKQVHPSLEALPPASPYRTQGERTDLPPCKVPMLVTRRD